MTHKLNKARATDLHMTMMGYVGRDDIPGSVTLTACGDEIHVDAIGMKILGGKEPIGRNTIFRVASITKPMTAAVTMIVVDEGKIQLDESLEHRLPELSNRKALSPHATAKHSLADCIHQKLFKSGFRRKSLL
jgi:CubicO group peptidase (beta-lactamase class C family)